MLVPYTLGEHKITIPTTWKDITVKQWFELQSIDTTDVFSLLAVLSGATRELWLNCTEVDVEYKLLPNLKFLEKPINLSLVQVPKTVTIAGQSYKVPQKLITETLGQKIMFEAEIEKHSSKTGDVDTKAIPMALAIYLCPKNDKGEIDDTKINAFAELVLNSSIVECYPVATFFLLSFRKYLKRTKGYSLRK